MAAEVQRELIKIKQKIINSHFVIKWANCCAFIISFVGCYCIFFGYFIIALVICCMNILYVFAYGYRKAQQNYVKTHILLHQLNEMKDELNVDINNYTVLKPHGECMQLWISFLYFAWYILKIGIVLQRMGIILTMFAIDIIGAFPESIYLQYLFKLINISFGTYFLYSGLMMEVCEVILGFTWEWSVIDAFDDIIQKQHHSDKKTQ